MPDARSPKNRTVSATAKASSIEAPVIITVRTVLAFDVQNIAQVISTGISTNKDKKFISVNLF